MIFVTGGTGLVGSHVLFDLAKAGKKLRALKRSSSSTAAVKRLFQHYAPGEHLFEQIEWVEGDLHNSLLLEDQLHGIEEVYHCAAVVSFTPKDRNLLLESNITGTANIVNAALEANVKRFGYVSSTAAIGGKADGKPVTEKVKWQGDYARSDYAISKHYGEREVWRGAEEGLSVVIVNPCVVVGPGAWGKSSTSMIKQVWKGLKFFTGGGNAFIDARDVSRSLIALMNSDIQSQRFLVTSDNMSYRDFFNIAAEALNKPKPTLHIKPIVTETIWRMERVLEVLFSRKPMITKATAFSSQANKAFSSQKIKDALDIDFIPVEQSIRDTCALFLKEVEMGVVK